MNIEDIKLACVAGFFSALVLGFLSWLNNIGGYGLWLMAPFGATAVLVFGIPNSPLAQPKNVIFGHLLTAFVGIVFVTYVGDGSVSIALAVGFAITLMMLTKTVHPAAGANPILIIVSGQSWDFLIMPVLVGTMFIVICGFAAKWLLSSSVNRAHKKTA
ncbi:HPP family protein [Pseudoalteromonas sp. SWXJZ10B]|uniref:HPP family protein n=1 Tax=Pseudoalteromonas sp. SWXJZ10B TaxID=2792063 RepID=UPI0018CDB737|nr:HPP family protein [Pseudoalteromonas sp. SWXJZ10B]MBH0044231.1 HPP family protein [Pseudoalteromonas sp. SWXJZ10B]